MDNVNERNLPTAENTAEAEKKEKKVATDLGKFESVDALLDAYRALEAEFTRRSQRLKELENGSKAQDMPEEGAPSRGGEVTGEQLLKSALESEEVRRAVIEEYLKALCGAGSVPLISEGGVAPATPKKTPKSIKEAGALAVNFLKK